MLKFKITKKERFIGIIAACVILAAIADKFFYQPIRDKFSDMSKKIFVEEKKVSANLRNVAQKDIILDEYKKLSAYVAPMGTDEEEISRFLSIIEETARNTNVYVSGMKPQPTAKIDFYKRYVVELDIEASAERLMDFLYRLESLNQLINVEELQLTTKNESPKMLKIRLLVTRILVS